VYDLYLQPRTRGREDIHTRTVTLFKRIVTRGSSESRDRKNIFRTIFTGS
jgi:hypothetical protein